jgi:quercetin dioxygenase-like cupin family protein
MTTFGSISQMRPYAIWKGAVARAVEGDRTTVAVVDLDPDLLVPEHQHENEQVGFVLRGIVTMTIDGVSRELNVGDTYVIPSNVRHSAQTSGQGATVVDVFVPMRSDWAGAERLAPSPGLWP